jgi:hypothetical protein
VDRTKQKDLALLEAAFEAVHPLGLRFRVLGHEPLGRDPRADTLVGLRFGGLDIRYVVEIKRGIRPAALGAVIHQLRRHRPPALLVADYVTPPLADKLQTEGIEFIDTAGNAFLNHPPLLVFVEGRRRTGEPPASERGRAFQATGLQVLFALLARPELVDRPYRMIATRAGVAHGTVGWVMAELVAQGYVATIQGHRRLIDGDRLLDRWVEAYARTLRPKLLLGRFRGDLARLDANALRKKDLLVGGEPAAARLTRHLRPGTATFYAEEIQTDVIVGLTLRADDRGNVDFRRRFWAFRGEVPGLVPTLLVYADLLAIGEARCLETAELLRDQIRDRLVK